MPIRHLLKTAYGSVLAIAILAAPGVASAQSLFGTQTPTIAPSPAASTPPVAKKPVAKRRPRRVALTNATTVNIINKRPVTLVELSVTSKAAKNAKPQIVAHDLASGRKTSARLAKKGGCVYAVSGAFADKSTVDASALDLCKDDNLNLVE